MRELFSERDPTRIGYYQTVLEAEGIQTFIRNENLSGKIGVESVDRVVTLSGYTLTSGQAYRAGRDARSVEGVRSVRNEIRPRVGGSVS